MSCNTDRRRRRGFTLLELLVVLAIIATLAGVVAPGLFRNVGDAQRTATKTQIEMFALALESYRLDNGDYPSTAHGLQALRTMPVSDAPPRNWRGPYLTKPVPNDPWGRAYQYRAPGQASPQSYDLYTLGKDGRPGGEHDDADITSWGGAVTP